MVTVTVDLTEVPLVVEDDAGNGRIKVVHNCTIFLCSLDVGNIKKIDKRERSSFWVKKLGNCYI